MDKAIPIYQPLVESGYKTLSFEVDFKSTVIQYFRDLTLIGFDSKKKKKANISPFFPSKSNAPFYMVIIMLVFDILKHRDNLHNDGSLAHGILCCMEHLKEILSKAHAQL